MPTSVFFSWQVDTSPKEGRNFIERALERAVGRIADDVTLEEAVRSELEVDRDTKGISGSPPIVETIFRKIDSAAVFVPDLTFVGKRLDQRPTPNPNVLIEYGWAIRSLGYGRLVPVMNTAFGYPTPESMPFDLRHLRNPILYHCPVDASEESRKEVREKLVKDLEQAIQEVFKSNEFKQATQKKTKIEPFKALEPKDGRGRFCAQNNSVGIADNFFANQNKEIKISAGPVIWFRLMPTSDQAREWLITDLKKAATQNEMLCPIGEGWTSLNYLRSAEGFGVYAPQRDPDTLTSSIVFAFKSGEVWAVDSYMLQALTGHGQNIIPPMEKEFQRVLVNYGNFLSRLGIAPPFRWIIGMENLKGRRVVDRAGSMAAFRGYTGLCVTDVIVEEGLFDPKDSAAKSLHSFFAKLFDSCGLELSKPAGK